MLMQVRRATVQVVCGVASRWFRVDESGRVVGRMVRLVPRGNDLGKMVGVLVWRLMSRIIV